MCLSSKFHPAQNNRWLIFLPPPMCKRDCLFGDFRQSTVQYGWLSVPTTIAAGLTLTTEGWGDRKCGNWSKCRYVQPFEEARLNLRMLEDNLLAVISDACIAPRSQILHLTGAARPVPPRPHRRVEWDQQRDVPVPSE